MHADYTKAQCTNFAVYLNEKNTILALSFRKKANWEHFESKRSLWLLTKREQSRVCVLVCLFVYLCANIMHMTIRAIFSPVTAAIMKCTIYSMKKKLYQFKVCFEPISTYYIAVVVIIHIIFLMAER